jgi:hypothetical protein
MPSAVAPSAISPGPTEPDSGATRRLALAQVVGRAGNGDQLRPGDRPRTGILRAGLSKVSRRKRPRRCFLSMTLTTAQPFGRFLVKISLTDAQREEAMHRMTSWTPSTAIQSSLFRPALPRNRAARPRGSAKYLLGNMRAEWAVITAGAAGAAAASVRDLVRVPAFHANVRHARCAVLSSPCSMAGLCEAPLVSPARAGRCAANMLTTNPCPASVSCKRSRVPGGAPISQRHSGQIDGFTGNTGVAAWRKFRGPLS